MDGQPGLFGFGPRAAARQRDLEQQVLALASTDSVAELSRSLAARPHVAGSPADAATRDFVVDRMRSWGLDVSTAEYEIYLPYPTEVLLERLTPEPRQFSLREAGVSGATGVPAADDPEQWPAWHAYAAPGDVRGPLVYVNYAREADLARLVDLGIRLEGRIAIGRYGGEIFRGNKVLNVQRRGAIGCILYSDPYDDGYFRGDTYPAGPMRPPDSIQRGSLNTGAGDPTAPGRVSLPGVPRLPREQCTALPSIPSLPVGYGVAQELLAGLRGPEVPQEWQGALPFRYHLGPGPVEVRLRTADDGRVRPIWNTFGRIAGAEFPDEWIVIGGHRDAWCCGAVDNVSGVTSVMEAARICAALARAGHPPRRTLIFATWDAEEWGLVGSTEWVEQHRDELAAKVVAYINQDVAVTGPNFGASASPTLADLLRDVAAVVPSPDQPDRSVYQTWTGERDQPPAIGQPGGGSDHEGFFLHLGIPACAFGFSGPWGNYHSAYDATDWLERFGDPGYRRHRAAASLTAILTLRLANAAMPPLSYVPYAECLAAAVARSKEQAAAAQLATSAFEPLSRALRQFKAAATLVTSASRATDWDALSAAHRIACVTNLNGAERALTRPGDDRPAEFHRNLVFGVNPHSGYAAWALPGVTDAIESRAPAVLEPELRLIADRLAIATRHLRAAANVLR